MTEQELTYNLNQELRCCASGFHSIHESRLAILALFKEADWKSPKAAKDEGYYQAVPFRKREE